MTWSSVLSWEATEYCRQGLMGHPGGFWSTQWRPGSHDFRMGLSRTGLGAVTNTGVNSKASITGMVCAVCVVSVLCAAFDVRGLSPLE